MTLFDFAVAYPSDDVGPYLELWGKVLTVSERFYTGQAIEVRTNEGVFSGYTNYSPKPSSCVWWAKIRIYDSGGGFYPDNKIMEWTSTKPEGLKDD
jgi:hypothetical protein